jgi:hypothetical protein
VGVAEVVGSDGAEGGDEVVGDVVAVADVGGGLEGELLVLEPGREVVGDGLVGVGAEPRGLTLAHPAQGGPGGVGGGVAAAADVVAPVVGTGEIEGEGPGAVIGVGGERGAAGSELFATVVAAAAPAVDVPGLGCEAHRDHFSHGRVYSHDHARRASAGGEDLSSLRTHMRAEWCPDLH